MFEGKCGRGLHLKWNLIGIIILVKMSKKKWNLRNRQNSCENCSKYVMYNKCNLIFTNKSFKWQKKKHLKQLIQLFKKKKKEE